MAHPDANIIFGTVIDDEMGDEVRVTVIAAGFDRWDDPKARADEAVAPAGPAAATSSRSPTCSATPTTTISTSTTTATTSTSPSFLK